MFLPFMLAYICSEALCERVHINRLGLTYLSGGRANNESGILSLKTLPRYECPRHRPKTLFETKALLPALLQTLL
jgi:hypothetical protein